MKFRKKPVVIEAVQFTEAVRDAALFDGQPLPDGVHRGASTLHPPTRKVWSASFFIETLEGRMKVSVGDWVITGIKGERYPCKPDIFAATYEPASQPDHNDERINMQRSQHPSNNAVLGAPPGMSIDECNALPITRIQYADGTPAVASYWKPTEAEQALIASGKPVRLVVLGTTHPPLMIGVDGDGEL